MRQVRCLSNKPKWLAFLADLWQHDVFTVLPKLYVLYVTEAVIFFIADTVEIISYSC